MDTGNPPPNITAFTIYPVLELLPDQILSIFVYPTLYFAVELPRLAVLQSANYAPLCFCVVVCAWFPAFMPCTCYARPLFEMREHRFREQIDTIERINRQAISDYHQVWCPAPTRRGVSCFQAGLDALWEVRGRAGIAADEIQARNGLPGMCLPAICVTDANELLGSLEY